MTTDINYSLRRRWQPMLLVLIVLIAFFQACLNSLQDTAAAQTGSLMPPLLPRSLTANSTLMQDGLHLYQARFNSEQGYGELLAFEANPASGKLGEAAWEAGERIPAADNRNIVTWNPDQNRGRRFLWDQLTSQQQAYLNIDPAGHPDARGEWRLQYLRGERSREQAESGPFRDRASLLGAIVNSAPVFAGDQDYGYAGTAADPEDTYQGFLDQKAQRDGMIYVGANDGMLHGFDTDGKERFAFVPDAVYSRLAALTAPDYVHQYYVDGPPAVADALINGGWRTVLVGALGAGGKSIYAIDVTYPDNLNEQSILWEFTHAELGHVLGQPSIVPLNSGEWGVIVGNGYEGESGSAQLFVIRLRDGTLIRRIDTGVNGINGLAPAAVYDAGFDRRVDRAYAGDLQGNLWSFDLASAQPSDWRVRYKPKPLYVAEDATGKAQPITTAPRIARTTDGYTMIFFGTGRFLHADDLIVNPDDPINSLYAIKDMGDTFTGRSQLTQHRISHQQTLSDHAVRVVRQSSERRSHGWYLDLIYDGIQTGERVVIPPTLRGRRILFTTLIPPSHPDHPDGGGFLMELAAESGNPLPKPVFDLDQDGTFDLVPGSAPDADGNVSMAPPAGIGTVGGGFPAAPAFIETSNAARPEDCQGEDCPCPPGQRHCTIININTGSDQIFQFTERDSLDGHRQWWRQVR